MIWLKESLDNPTAKAQLPAPALASK
jgi:hypothetical protein